MPFATARRFSIRLHCRQKYGIKAAPQPPLSGGIKVIGGSENRSLRAAIFPPYKHGPKVWRYSTFVPMAENDEQSPKQQATNRRASLVALGVVIVLFVVGWVLTRELYSNQKVEDCVLSGRTNCVPIDTQSSTY
jgi:hypothetical protein